MYILNAANAQLVTVYGSIGGQQIVNRYWWTYFGVLPNPHVHRSDLFLQAFRTAYRAQILPSFYDTYTVSKYTQVEWVNALLKGVVPHQRWEATFDPSKLELLPGAGADVGGQASVGLNALPSHEVLRVQYKAGTRALGYFKSNYWRVSGGWKIGNLSNSPEQWSAGFLAGQQANFAGLIATGIGGDGVNNEFFIATASIPYFGVIVKPLGGNPRDACRQSATVVAEPFVGTQITRRFNPTGGFRGV